MSGSLKKQAAERLIDLQEENETLQKKLNQKEERLQKLEKRARAEEIILEARKRDQAPDRLKADSVDSFLAKRANLEDEGEQELEKVATAISMWDDKGDDLVPAELPDSNDGHASFTDFLKDKTHEV